MLSQTDRVGRYELTHLLGQGSYCSVYEARERATRERIALKQLKRVGPVSLANFKREFRAVQGLHHRNLVELRELFEWNGACFIAMELVEGDDLMTHLRGGGAAYDGVDEAKLRDAFGQLAQALIALHAAAVVHRDIKPHNVLVTKAGRVVLLDFGLATTFEPGAEGSNGPVGTAAYMAPEQAAGAPLGPSADLYALGACLYEALTGAPPFAGLSQLELLQAKQRRLPPAPASIAHDAPAELSKLCMRLLQPTPSARPTSEETLRILRAGSAAPDAGLAQPESSPREDFTGRERELEALADAMTRSALGQFSLVLIEGDSGIGKSALVAEFLRNLQRQRPQALVLRSRCYENDLLAYKAFDGGMERLARALSELDRAACEALLPERVALLGRLFSSFSTVPAIAAAGSHGLPAEPTAQRLAGFATLCALLTRIAQERPLVIEIDDLQWADAESFRLLHAMGEDPQRPSALVVATVRPRAELSESAAAALARVQGWAYTQTLTLDGLARPAARTLAARLLHDVTNQALIDTLVDESRGHPLLLSELARYAEGHPLAAVPRRITLDEALRARIEALQAPAQALISAVALAGRPYPAQLFAAATGLEPSQLETLASELLGLKLLRRRQGHELACFHDRIRNVAQSRLSLDETRALHAGLAAALAAGPVTDQAELASHLDASGQSEPAAVAYARAAEQALLSLAFARAEQLCERALSLVRSISVPAQTLHALEVTRGHALARSGRSAEAARQYLQAAQSAEGEAKTRLRLWGVQHLLQSVRVQEGLDAARTLLAELGVPLPENPALALARISWDQFCLKLTRRAATAPPAAISMATRMQLDALWGLTLPLAWLDPLGTTALATRYLRIATASGEPSHTARALADEAFIRQYRVGDDPVSDTLLEQARGLWQASRDPVLDVSIAFREASVASFRFELPRARERLEHAHQVATESCPDQPWLLTNVRIQLGIVWMQMGEHARLAASTAAWLSEARDRNDQFGLTLIEGLGFGSVRHMMADDPDLARASMDAALASWPAEPFTFAHGGELIAVTHAEFYRGGDGAYRWLARERPRLARALLLKIGFGKATLRLWCALASLAAYNVTDQAGRKRLLSEARSHARALRGSTVMLAALNATSVAAQLEALEGRREAALSLARQAHAQSVLSGYAFLARSLDYLIGRLEGGDAGAQKQAGALAFFASQGWTRPRRAIAISCPAIDALEAAS